MEQARQAAEPPQEPTGELPQHIRFFGRRKGRPLNTARADALETLLPQLRIALPADGTTLDPVLLIPGKMAYRLEIGPGTGEHLLAEAIANPEIGFLTAEPFLNGSAALLAGIARENLNNIRILPDDVRPLLQALRAYSLEMIYLMFSDPWPKARHAKRRVLQAETLDQFARILQPGGTLRIATDDPTLQEWTESLLAERADFIARPGRYEQKPDWPQTRYEQKALQAGRQPRYYGYVTSG